MHHAALIGQARRQPAHGAACSLSNAGAHASCARAARQSFLDAEAFGWDVAEPAEHRWETLVGSVQDHIKSLNFGYRSELLEARTGRGGVTLGAIGYGT